MVFPHERNGRSRYGNPSLLFLRHKVHNGVTIINSTNGLRLTTKKQHLLRSGGFSSIDVCNNADVPQLLNGVEGISRRKLAATPQQGQRNSTPDAARSDSTKHYHVVDI